MASKYEAATKKAEVLMAQKAAQISQKEKTAQFLETLRQADDYIHFCNFERFQLKYRLTPFQKRSQTA